MSAHSIADSSVNTALGLFKSTIDALRNTETKSLVDVAKVARVEPITILDGELETYDGKSDILNCLQLIFAGYYIQAVSLLGTKIDGISVDKVLGPLNPSGKSSISFESLRYKLPTVHNNQRVSLENNIKVNSGELDGIKSSATLSTGQMYTVTIGNDGKTANVPVSIRLAVNIVPSEMFVSMTTFRDSFDTQMVERWHSYRAGRLSLFKDLIFCNDLIDKYRKNLLNDKNDIYKQIINRETNSKIKAIIDGNANLATASNIAVIDSTTAKTIESKLNMKLKDFNGRNIVFNATNLMLLAVVSKDDDVVKIYTRGIAESTTMTTREMRSAGKDKDSTMDILKAYLSGSSVSL